MLSSILPSIKPLIGAAKVVASSLKALIFNLNNLFSIDILTSSFEISQEFSLVPL